MHSRIFLSIVPVVLVAIAFCLPAVTHAKVKSKPKKKRVNPVFAPVKDDPGLPRVLIIGDSISIGYTLGVRANLKGNANVHRAPTNCGPTTRGLAKIDEWLGKEKWDVIHFNWGLHDLKYITKTGKRVHPDKGKIQVPKERYEKNLRKLVQRMKKTGAVLIWCSTTPVPEGSHGRIAGDSVKYNAVARKVMESEKGVITNDLYAFTKPQLGKIQNKRDVHFHRAGNAVISKYVAGVILKHLPRSKPKAD